MEPARILKTMHPTILITDAYNSLLELEKPKDRMARLIGLPFPSFLPLFSSVGLTPFFQC